METPETAVAGYLEQVGPGPHADVYVPEIVARHGVEALVAAVVRATRSVADGSPDVEGARRALLFVRDVATGWAGPPWDDLVPRFREAMPASGLFEALATCLHAPRFATRQLAVYTFGKLHFLENARTLGAAFTARRDTDPFLLPDLVSEIAWIEAEAGLRWSLVRQLMASPAEVSRWAALAVLQESTSMGEPETVGALSDALQRDASPFVRAEAAHFSAGLALAAAGRAMTPEQRKASRAEARQERKRVDALRPEPTFAQLEARFTQGRDDYAVEDVLAFLAPLRPPP